MEMQVFLSQHSADNPVNALRLIWRKFFNWN